MECYQRAAKTGYPAAFYDLGFLYFNCQGVNKDINKAIEYYQKAAKLGNPNAIASLGNIYLNGQGVKQDINKAIEYYQKAVEFSHAGASNKHYNYIFYKIEYKLILT